MLVSLETEELKNNLEGQTSIYKLPLANWLRQALNVRKSPEPAKTHTALRYMTYNSSQCSSAVENLRGSKDWHFIWVTGSV
jgi:hypothetical protein